MADSRPSQPSPRPAQPTEHVLMMADGGRSPILERTRRQAAALAAKLNEAPDGPRWRVHVAMRHRDPFIEDTLAGLRDEGVTRIVGLVMAPHHSRTSAGDCYARVEEAASGLEIVAIERWHRLDGYLDALADRVRTALQAFPEKVRSDVPVIFTAPSLPERILGSDDPYPRELRETVAAVAGRIAPQPYTFAYQSAPTTPDPWLGPDVGAVVSEFASAGIRHLLIAPVGFVTEPVESLFDIDVELRSQAQELGVHLDRIQMLDDHPCLIAGLADLVRARAAQAGWLPPT